MKIFPTTEAFVPPGVQQKLFAKLRVALATFPVPLLNGSRISALWTRRNNCAESEIAAIDYQMECEMIDGWVRLRVEDFRAKIGNRITVGADVALAMIATVAPSEERAADVARGLADPASILLWSPDGAGGLRYDQPGTLTHTPPILFAPRDCRLPHLPRNTVIVRVKPSRK